MCYENTRYGVENHFGRKSDKNTPSTISPMDTPNGMKCRYTSPPLPPNKWRAKCHKITDDYGLNA